MADLGLDFSYARPSVTLLHRLGVKFVCRYLSYPSGKVIGKAEYDNYNRNGIEVFLNWEFQATDGAGGATSGRSHAIEAVRQAKALGYPVGATIYFSIGDFDIFGQGKTAACDAYALSALQVVRGAGYRFGVYGSQRYLSHLRQLGRIDDGWESPSTFSNTPKSVQGFDPRNTIHQTNLDVNYDGNAVDKNLRVGVTHSSLSKPPVIEGDDLDMTPQEKADFLTANAVSFALAHGADTYWLYSADGKRVSTSLKPFYDKLKAVVKSP